MTRGEKRGEAQENRAVFSEARETPDHPVETSGQGERETHRDRDRERVMRLRSF